MSKVIILSQDGEIKSIKMESGLKYVKTYFKKKTDPEVLGTYLYKNIFLTLFGYQKGKAGTENKHELPPPHEATVAFGDLVLIASKEEDTFTDMISITEGEYEIFYNKAFGEEEDEDEEELVEEEVLEEVDEEIEGIEEEVFEKLSIISEPEEVIEEKPKGKKKRVASILHPIIAPIHPNKQLQPTSEKNSFRIETTEKILQLFQSNSLNDLSELEVFDLEQGIYCASLVEADKKHIIKDWKNIHYILIYKSVLRKIIVNLNKNLYIKNNEMIQLYKENKVSLQDICKMDHYKLLPSKWDKKLEQQAVIEKRQLEGNKSMATEQFLCTKCFKRECTYYEMQTRSADEPMTIFINCLNCGKNWRQ